MREVSRKIRFSSSALSKATSKDVCIIGSVARYRESDERSCVLIRPSSSMHYPVIYDNLRETDIEVFH